MNVRKLLRQLRTHPETTTIDFSGFRPSARFVRHLRNESAKDMRIIARRIKIVHEKGNHEEDVHTLCLKFNLTFLSRINDTTYVFVKKDSLTKYESENGVITISAYKGDSWFKDIDSRFSNENIPTLADLSLFYMSLNDERKSETDPIKLRTLDYSIHLLQQRYVLDYFETDQFDIFVLKSRVLILNKATEERLEIEIRPIRGLFNRILKVYQRLGFVFYATAISVIAVYSLQSIQIDVIAPFIYFAPYNHEIGDLLDSAGPVSTIYDNMDSFPGGVNYQLVNPPRLMELGVWVIDYKVIDRSNNSRLQSTTINVVDTTPPVISSSNVINVIEYDDYRLYDYLKLINADDNHKISTLTYQLPYGKSLESKPLGNYTVSFNAQDPSGNKSSFNRQIVIVDTVPPTFDLRNQTITVNYDERRTFNYASNAVNINDNYDTKRVRFEFSTAYDYENPGSHPFTLTAIDVAGNSTSRTMSVNIVDRTPPFVRVVATTTINVNNLSSFNPSAMILETRDNHRIASTTQSPVSILNNKIGVVNFETIVTDASGNRTIAITKVNIVDTTPPNIQILRTSDTFSGTPTRQNILSMVRITDNFDTNPVVTISTSPVAGDTSLSWNFNVFNTVYITAVDSSNNVRQVSVRVRPVR